MVASLRTYRWCAYNTVRTSRQCNKLQKKVASSSPHMASSNQATKSSTWTKTLRGTTSYLTRGTRSRITLGKLPRHAAKSTQQTASFCPAHQFRTIYWSCGRFLISSALATSLEELRSGAYVSASIKLQLLRCTPFSFLHPSMCFPPLALAAKIFFSPSCDNFACLAMNMPSTLD